MNVNVFGSVEMQMLWLSIALGLLQLLLVVVSVVLAGRLGWALGARDADGPAPGKIGGRLERALDNFVQTFVFFAAAVLMGQALGKHSPTSVWGAQLYFWARVAYVPLYAFGIPVARTLAWGVSFAGIAMALWAACGG